MATDKNGYLTVLCENCGREIRLCESYKFGEFDKKHEIHFFCSASCALEKLFGIVNQVKEFMLGLENAR